MKAKCRHCCIIYIFNNIFVRLFHCNVFNIYFHINSITFYYIHFAITKQAQLYLLYHFHENNVKHIIFIQQTKAEILNKIKPVFNGATNCHNVTQGDI